MLPFFFALTACAANKAEARRNSRLESLSSGFTLSFSPSCSFGSSFLNCPARFFRPNADRISEAISKATAAKAEADRLLREAAVKLTTLEQEVAAFRATALKESTAEVERLRAATRNEAEKSRRRQKRKLPQQNVPLAWN